MAKYLDKSQWEDQILIPDEQTPILGGQPEWDSTNMLSGWSNVPAGMLADRTRFLLDKILEVEQEVGQGSENSLQKDNNLSDLQDVSQAKFNLGLNLVDNVRDTDKPVSVAQQAALDIKTNISDLASADPDKGAGMVGYRYNAPFAEYTSQAEVNARVVHLNDVLTEAERMDVFLRVGAISVTSKINALIDLLSEEGGGKLMLPKGRINAEPVLKSGVTLIGEGYSATVLVQSSGHVIRASGTLGSATLLTADAGAGDSTISLASTGGLAPGDWLVISDEADYSTISDAAGYKSGESVQVLSIDSATQVTLRMPLYGSMRLDGKYTIANGAKVRVVSPVSDVGVIGLSIEGLGATNTNMVDLRFVRGAMIDVSARNFAGSGVNLHGCMDVKVTGFYQDGVTNIPAGKPGYGVAVSGPCDNIDISHMTVRRVRHAVTTIGGADGLPHNVYITDCVAEETTAASFDTHDAGWNVRFKDCTSIHSAVGGFLFRSPHTSAERCRVLWPATGGCFGFTGDNARYISLRSNYAIGGSYGFTGATKGPGLEIVDNTSELSGLSAYTVTVFDPSTLEVSRNKALRFGTASPSQRGFNFTSAALDPDGAIFVDNFAEPNGAAQAAIRLTGISTKGCAGNRWRGSYTEQASNTGYFNFGADRNLNVPTSAYAVIEDDSVFSLEVRSSMYMIAHIGASSKGATYPNGMISFRANTSPDITAMTTFPANVVFGTGPLTGTTGIDGDFTIHADNRYLHFENRSGGSRHVWVSIVGPQVL